MNVTSKIAVFKHDSQIIVYQVSKPDQQIEDLHFDDNRIPANDQGLIANRLSGFAVVFVQRYVTETDEPIYFEENHAGIRCLM